MGYLHIQNLYRDKRIFDFDECYALEKIHGTSAHIKYTEGNPLHFFSGGAKNEEFKLIFNEPDLLERFKALGQKEVQVFGEAYGGKMQGMRKTYGDELKFIAFDAKLNGEWLEVPIAHTLVTYLKLEFVDWKRIPCTLEDFDKERTAPSTQAKRNGIEGDQIREGIVLRPLKELYDEYEERIITKYKNPEFSETLKVRKVEKDPKKLELMTNAKEIALEWVTPNRLKNVLNQAQTIINATEGISRKPLDMTDTKVIIEMMCEDVKREAKGEILESLEVRKAICTRTGYLFKKWLIESLNEVKGNIQ